MRLWAESASGAGGAAWPCQRGWRQRSIHGAASGCFAESERSDLHCVDAQSADGDPALAAAPANKQQLPLRRTILFWLMSASRSSGRHEKTSFRHGSHARGDITPYFLLIWVWLQQDVGKGDMKRKKSRKTPPLANMSTPCTCMPAWVPFHVCHWLGIWWWSTSFLCSHVKQGRGDLHE